MFKLSNQSLPTSALCYRLKLSTHIATSETSQCNPWRTDPSPDLAAIRGPKLGGLVPELAGGRRHPNGVAARVEVRPRIGRRVLPVVVRLGGRLRNVNLRLVY